MRKLSTKELLLVFLDSFVGLEYKHKQSLFNSLTNCDSIKKFIVDNKDYIKKEIGENEYNTLFNSANEVYLDYVLKGLDKRGIDVITIASTNFPEKLKNIEFAPLVLYAKGDISLLNSLSLGVVGSRKSLPIQIKIAENFCNELIDNGFTLVTGTAEGVDAVALKTIEKGGKVISVMANGFDHVYPASNKHLLDSVINNGGLVITEHTYEVVAKPYLFPIRNRIIAGLSDGVLVASGNKKSGTMYTAEYAEQYSKPVFAVPYNVGIISGEGCNELIKKGAYLVDSPQDILNHFNIENKQESEQKTQLSSEEKEIISLLKTNGEMHIEKISEKLNTPIFMVSPLLSVLEIRGEIVKTGVNVFSVIK